MKDKYEQIDLKPYLIYMGLVVLVIIYFRPIIGVIALVLYVYLSFLLMEKVKEKDEYTKNYIENMNNDFDSVTKQAIFSMPFPLIITNENGEIIWYNSEFASIYENENLMNKDISDIVKDIHFNDFINPESEVVVNNIVMNERDYYPVKSVVDVKKTSSSNEKLCMFYFLDKTEYNRLYEKYIDESPVVAKIEVDNFDEAIDSATSKTRPQLVAEIDSTIRDYFKDFDALVRKYSDNMYLVIMDYKSLLGIKEKRFDLLDDLRELDNGNSIPITLSIGVSSVGLNFREAYEESDSCLDLALGRGGDQAVVKVNDNYEFFGGKSKAVEKRNKVKARVLGVALRQLIDRASDVYIMGHKNADMDAIGSAIGVLRAVLNRDKEGYIVLSKSNPSIDNLLNRMREEEPEIYNKIIKEDTAKNSISQSSLLIMVDNHKPSFTEAPSLIGKTSQVVVIDHHRRGKEFVENPVLTYVEPYASSTSELVTEMLTYMNDELDITHFEADALMSGIVVDTKNFSFQTGVRTFEAASILRRAGADMNKVKQLFQDDLDTILSKAEVIHNTKLVFEEVAISKLEKRAENSILIAAQAADELLDLSGIRASFVLTEVEGEYHISGRSKGDFSVQLILEGLGGGGHLNMAGARIAADSMDEAEDILTEAVRQYIELNRGEKKK